MNISYDVSLTLFERWKKLNKLLLIFASLLAFIGSLMLYSAADGNVVPWAGAHFVRYILGISICVIISLCPIEWVFKPSYILYFMVLILLIATAVTGETHKGAQRWLNLGVFRLQPSEIAKITTVLALARFFHESYKYRILPIYIVAISLLIIILPAVFVLKQPDLGTALLLIFSGLVVMLMAGLDWKIFATGGLATLLSLPLIWFGMQPYQKQRVLTFLDPGSDPLGSGYHILQAKIAMGSGGLTGRGFMKGPQSSLEFLPEKHTDFAYTAYAEQFGFLGSIGLLMLFAFMIFMMILMAYRTRHIFGKLLIMGLTANFFFYIFINISMITGLTPVVGVPLPFISYGGTVMLSIFIALGLIQNSYINDGIRA